LIQEQANMLIDSKILLKDEQELVKKGDLEVPELTNYMISDDNYLQ